MTDAPKAPAKRGPRKKAVPATPVVEAPAPVVEEEPEQLYIRNRGGVRISVKVPRAKNEKYSYRLAPRGERGDAEPVDEGDITYLTHNAENEGLYEIITHSEAMAYMGKQTRNQQRFHPALAALTDEFGNPITGIGHERQAITATTSNVTVPEGDLNKLNRMPPGRPE